MLEIYKEARTDIQAIYRSRLMTEILLSLNEGMKNLSQLREITGSTSQALIPKIRKLESYKFVESKKNGYCLTQIGKIVASNIEASFLMMGVINKHKFFWTDHCLETFPTSLLNDIGCLYDSKFIHDTKTDIFSLYKTNLQIIQEADYVFGISSIVTEDYVEYVSQKACKGMNIDFIVTPDVAERIKQYPYAEKINSLKNYDNFQLNVINKNIDIGLIVTNKCLSLCLHKKERGIYDITNGLLSFDQMAIDWGQRLFEYYKNQAYNKLI